MLQDQLDHLWIPCADSLVQNRPSLRVLLGHICLVLQEDLGRFYVTQGNSQVQQGPAPRIPLVNILSVSEREGTQLIRAYTNKGLIQESIFPAIPTDPFPNSPAPPFCGAVLLPHVNKKEKQNGAYEMPQKL